MSTTQELKDHLLQTFYDTVDMGTMNFEQMDLFLKGFFDVWSEHRGELFTDAEVKEMCERAYWEGRDDTQEDTWARRDVYNAL